MRQIDTPSATGTKPTPPAAGAAKWFTDTAGSNGTIVPAWFLNSVQDEIINAISGAGLTPNKADDTQLLQAITALTTKGYLHVRDEKASGTNGGTFSSGSWVTRTLNTEKTNNITGATLSSNQITLPSGTYRILASAPAYNTRQHKVRIRDITSGSTILVGTNANPDDDAQMNTAFAKGQFTLSAETIIEFQHRCTSSQSTNGLGQPASFGVVEVYAEVEIWEV